VNALGAIDSAVPLGARQSDVHFVRGQLLARLGAARSASRVQLGAKKKKVHADISKRL